MKLRSITLAVLATTAAAHPYRRDAQPDLVRREAQVVTQYIDTSAMPVVYVDEYGNRISTGVQAVGASATDPSVVPEDFDLDDSDPYSSTTSSSSSTFLPSETTIPPPASSGSTSDGTYEDGNTENGEIVGHAIAYAPYNADHSCKTKEQIDTDVDALESYSMIRIYGTDCEQVPIIMEAARRNGMQVFAGIWRPEDAAVEAQLLIDGAKDDWSRVHTVSVGNEVLTNGTSLETLRTGISTAKSLLRAAGYEGPLTTVEVYSKLWEDQYKPLCNDIDYVASNIHPYFNALQTPENAGKYVREQADDLRVKFCNKDVVVTEAGWPSAGSTNGNAVPNPDNQRIAIQALKEEFSSDKGAMFLFSAFNDDWKSDNKYGVEHYWGIYGNAPSAR